MSDRNKRNDDDNKRGSPAWMTTFGDMMTLLLVFFVLLYSFSVMDLEKFRGFISSLQNQLGVLEGGTTISEQSQVARGSQGDRFNRSRINVSQVMREMEQYIERRGLQDQVNMEMTQRGLVVRLTGQVLYDLGKAEIKPGGRELLTKIADTIRDVPNNIMVEGHTDNLPINNEQFPSNWELSTTRATNVIRFFIEEIGLDPRRLAAAGYSEYRPLHENDTPEHRAQNRRVEIVVLNTTTVAEEGDNNGG